jgi:hypothetical protein
VKWLGPLALILSACGGGATCPDDPTACRGRIQIRWFLMTEELDTFDFNETCLGVGADLVKLEISGARAVSETFACQDGQTILMGLPVGDYTITATLLEEDDLTGERTPLTGGQTTSEFSFDETDVTADVIFAFGDFLRGYRGSYYFKASWAGTRMCAQANPPVARVRVRLERDRQPLGGMTSDGMPLDGSATGSCKDFMGSPYLANDLPWGPATISVSGLDVGDREQFAGSWDTFIGAGRSNPEFQFDVDSLGLAPDAGPPPDSF